MRTFDLATLARPLALIGLLGLLMLLVALALDLDPAMADEVGSWRWPLSHRFV